MAVEKKDIVKAKYVITNIFSLGALVINFLFLLIATKNLFMSVFVALAVFFLGVIVVEIMLPLIFKYGVEKGRTLLLVIILILSSIVTAILKGGQDISENVIVLTVTGIPILYVIMNFVSYFISVKIFENSEL